MNLASLPLKGSLTHFKREERQIVTLLHEDSLTKSYSLTSSFPKVLLPPGRLQSKSHRPAGERHMQTGTLFFWIFLFLFFFFYHILNFNGKAEVWLNHTGAGYLTFKQAGRDLLEINRWCCSLVRFTTVITSHSTIRLYSHVNLVKKGSKARYKKISFFTVWS